MTIAVTNKGPDGNSNATLTAANAARDFSYIAHDHFHNIERWFGASAGQVAPGIQAPTGIITPYRVTTSALAGTLGTEIAVFNGTETFLAFQTLFDPHRLNIVNVQGAATYMLRMAFNANGEATFAAAVANNHYTDIVFKVDATNNDSVPIDIKCGRMPVGSKIWIAAAKAVAAPSAYWIEFYLGCHAYPARPGI